MPSPRLTSDWIGFACFAALSVLTVAGGGTPGLLLLPGLLGELMVAGSFLVRRRPRQTLRGAMPRLVAYAGSFLMPTFVYAAARWQPEWLAPAQSPELRALGLSLWTLGLFLTLWPLLYLRQSFSLIPAARDLVTSGPYRLVRHPIYAAYLFTYVGVLLNRFTVPLALAVASWTGLILLRIRYEELVLTSAFPEYVDYRKRVGGLFPRPR